MSGRRERKGTVGVMWRAALGLLLVLALALMLSPTAEGPALAEESQDAAQQNAANGTDEATAKADATDGSSAGKAEKAPTGESADAQADASKATGKGTTRSPSKAPAKETPTRSSGQISVQVTNYGSETPIEGIYQKRTVYIKVTPAEGVTLATGTPTLELTYTDDNYDEHTRTVTVYAWTVATDGSYAQGQFDVTETGTYTAGTLTGVKTTGEDAEGSFNLNFEVVPMPHVAHVWLLKKDGNGDLQYLTEEDDDTKRYDLLAHLATATTDDPVAKEATAIEVMVRSPLDTVEDIPNNSSTQAESPSYAVLVSEGGKELATATFKKLGDGSYVARFTRRNDNELPIPDIVTGNSWGSLPEGPIGIKVVAKDQFGTSATQTIEGEAYEYTLVAAKLEDAKVKADMTFYLDKGGPVIEVSYPQDDRVSGYDPAADGATVLSLPTEADKTDFFDHEMVVNVTIEDNNIEMNTSTVDGHTLAQIQATGSDGFVDGNATYAYWHSMDSDEFGVRVTYGDGCYQLPVVSAKDMSHANPVVYGADKALEEYGIDHFIVDTTPPTVSQAMVNADPALTTTDTNGNKVVFFKSDGSVYIGLEVTEPFGIRTIELVDASGRYSLGSDVADQATAGNGGILDAAHTGTYQLQLVDELVEDNNFSDGNTETREGLTLRLTDFAGNAHTWSLAKEAYEKPAADEATSPDAAELAHPSFGGTTLGHPTLLVLDNTAPALTLTGVSATGPVPGYERYLSANQTVLLTLAERNFRFLRGMTAGDGVEDEFGDIEGTGFLGTDAQQTLLTISGTYPETVAVSDTDVTGTDGTNYQWTRTFTEDGRYQLDAKLVDVVGQSATASIDEFVIDKTAPTIAVSYDNDNAHNGHYYDATRTATITVVEHNFDPDLFEVACTFENHAVGATEPQVSWDSSSTDTHTCTVSFPSDGAYDLTVTGIDKAGNVAVLASDASTEGYDSGTFVIDTENPVIAKYYDNGTAPSSTFDADDPVVEFPPPTGTYAGTNYYAHEITLPIRVKDRNIDAANTATDLTVKVTRNGNEGSRAVGWARVPDERGENGYEQWQTSITFEEDGEYRTPHVTAKDLAERPSDNAADTKPFVIDLNPPDLSVTIDHKPASQGISGNSGDPVNFYNEQTKLALFVSDEHLLRSVEIEDPDDNYTITKTSADAEGKPNVTLLVQLKDGTPARDAEYQRDIVLTAIDLAGNERTWTIDHKGTIKKDEKVDGAWKQVQSAAENAAIDGEHPVALIQDTVAPVVSLSGVEAGKYYNKPQTVVAKVHELNFEWLKQFDPSRTIVTVTKYEGNASRAMSSWTIPASSFTGSKPNYNFSQLFSSDGHYVVTAQFRDFATNLSNKATIGEFTIDMTAPTIKIDFDNNDVRNGKYYKATRTATITVTEHNFSPDLIKIETNGTIGVWMSSGDTHTCTVFFGEGGPYNLKVGGKDLAGNEAEEVTVEEFIVDLTVPEVTIAGTAQRLGVVGDEGRLTGAYHDTLEDKNAYNGVVLPLITYKDNEVLSSDDLSFALTGSKHGKDTVFEAQTSPEDKEMTVALADLGYKGSGAGDGSNWRNFYVSDYESDADDIYTLSAKLCDQAGNEAEAELTFSVNRFGSNYDVRLLGLSEEESEEYESSGILWESPTIVVREINVSGVGESGRQRVEKEFANVTSAIKRSEGDGLGYALTTIEGDAQANGWSEYVYTVRSANFGEGSDSDHDDRGQGVYRVNVTSDDTSSNANTTAEYWRSDARRTEVTAAGATAQFVLDELGPTIEDLDVPTRLSRGSTYEASFHVNDDITSGNTVEVYVDGKKLGAAQVQGPANGAGTFTFRIEGKPFNWARSVRVVVRDYAGREAEAKSGNWFWQSTFLMEGGVAVLLLAMAGVVAYAVVRAMRDAEPELPEL